jgi:ribosomal protein L40E
MKKQKSPTICKNCGAELSSKAKVCRYCRTKVKKPAHKKWWVWLLVLALLGSCVGKNEEPAEQKDSFENSADAVISDNTPIEENEPEEVPLFVTPEVPEETETPINETPVENQPVVEEIPEVIPPVEEMPAHEEPVEVTVYITNTGSKYHRGSCRFLDESKIPISLSDAQAMYEPCGTCDP